MGSQGNFWTVLVQRSVCCTGYFIQKNQSLQLAASCIWELTQPILILPAAKNSGILLPSEASSNQDGEKGPGEEFR